MKLDEAAVERVRAGAIDVAGGSLELAVVNGERQLVLSGDVEPAEAAVDLAFEAGGVARRLGIGGAYHTTLLAHAVDRFREDALAAVAGDPVVPIVCSTAGIVRHGAEVADVLSQALVRPVRWPDALQRAHDDLGVTRGLDAGPGLTLATIAKHTPILPFVGPATILLILSSVSCQYAVWAIRRDDRTVFLRGMTVTVVLGITFLLMQLTDYALLGAEGLTLSSGTYGTTYYTLTGFHGAHVFGGVIMLSVILYRGMAGQFSAKHYDAVEGASLYWHFVDVVWIVLFFVIYVVK